MPPKKRDKDDGTKNNIVSRDIQVEHELFLQAFEKPTQIYRYLRTRNMISPVFLHRTLTYMKHRMSRNHKRRNDFKIDNMLAEKLNKSRYDRNHCLGDYMSLMFLGFYGKTLLCNNDYMYNDIVRVETILLKISHKKRKDSSSSYIQESFGTIDIPVNPLDIDENDKIPAISIPTDAFTIVNGTPYNQSYILLLKVETIPKLTNILSDDGEEPCTKRQKSNTKIFGSELIIFDKHNRCLLAEGEYELALSEILTTATTTTATATTMTTTTAAATIKNSSPKKHTTWEIIPDDINFEMNDKYDNRFELFNKCPTLKFYLKWTNEPYTGYAKRPKPIIALPTTTSEAVAATAAAAATATATASTTITTNGTGMTMTTTASSVSTLTSTSTMTHHQINGIEKVNNLVNGNVHVSVNNNNNNCTSNKNGSKTSSSAANSNLIDYNNSVVNERLNERVQTIYQFIYNNNSRQQTEPCDDMHCPWCSLDCMTLYSLLKHLKLCHARFTFTYVPIGNNAARIDVAINDMYDGSYTGSPHDLVGPASGCAFARNGPVRRTTVTNLLVCRPRRQKPNLSEFLELDENELNNQRPYITGHNRLYHHTETCLPVHPKELDIDSEGESDPLWLQHKTMQMIDEFTDVNEGEKELMKMWNLHIMKYGYVGDCQLSIACDMFLDVRGKELLKKNLYRNFVLHMCSLFDYGLVSPEIVYKTIQKLQNILSTYPEGRKVIAESREAQLDYWLKFGIQKQAQQEELKQKQQQQQLRQQQQSQQTKQNDIKLSTNSGNVESNNKKIMEKDKLSRESVGGKDKDTVTSTTTTVGKISNGGNSNNGESQQQQQRQQNTSMTVLQRKRSLNSLQNEIIGGKRRLSQLRDSPPRRRSVPSSDQQSQQQQQQQNQQQPKTILARRKSVALFHTTTSTTTTTTVTDNKNSSSNSLSSSLTLASSSSLLSSSIPSNQQQQQQTTMRKRVASIAKVDKH